jgi:hypothetical protein
VEASNLCAETLIFSFFFLLSSVKVFFSLAFYCLFSFCRLIFVLPFFIFLFFLTLFYSCFFNSYGFISNLPQLAWDYKVRLFLLLVICSFRTTRNSEYISGWMHKTPHKAMLIYWEVQQNYLSSSVYIHLFWATFGQTVFRFQLVIQRAFLFFDITGVYLSIDKNVFSFTTKKFVYIFFLRDWHHIKMLLLYLSTFSS